MGIIYAIRIWHDALSGVTWFHFIFWRVEYTTSKYWIIFIGRLDNRTNLGCFLAIEQSHALDISSNVGAVELPSLTCRSNDESLMEVPHPICYITCFNLWSVEALDGVISGKMHISQKLNSVIPNYLRKRL